MGVLLVAFLFFLNLTVATGALHGLIFYANIVAQNRAVMTPNGTFQGLLIYLSWLNLDFGIETCFFDGMNQYAKTWLQFVFPVYLLTLVLLIIIACHKSSRVSHFFRALGNPVAVLATVVLLSYTKIVRIILASFSFAIVEYNEVQSVIVWLFDGNLVYAQGYHAVLFAFSFVVLVVLVVPYNIVLLTAQLLIKANCISSSSLFIRLKPFIDAYHGPYKTNHRYWTGLFLIVRTILLVIFAINFLGDASVNLLAMTTASLCIGSLSWIIGGVYQKRVLDGLEAMFLLNIGLFAAATDYIRASDNGNQPILANISLCFSFILFVLIIGVHVYLRIASMLAHYKSRKRLSHIRSTKSDGNLFTVSADGYVASSPTTQIIPSPNENFMEQSYSQLREPLVEDT